MKNFILLLVLCSSAFCVCAQRQLVPITYSKAYGDPTYMVLEADSITAVLEHAGTDGRFLIFDLEIANRSGRSVLVEPRQVHYYAGREPFAKLDTEDADVHTASWPNSDMPGTLRSALSRQAVEEQYEKQIRQEKAVAIVFGILSLGAVVADVALDVKDSKKEFFTKQDFMNAQNRDILVASSVASAQLAIENSSYSIHQKREDLHYLEQEFLQTIDLPDTSAVRGKIFFPKTGTYRYYRIVVPVGDLNYVFDFKKS